MFFNIFSNFKIFLLSFFSFLYSISSLGLGNFHHSRVGFCAVWRQNFHGVPVTFQPFLKFFWKRKNRKRNFYELRKKLIAFLKFKNLPIFSFFFSISIFLNFFHNNQRTFNGYNCRCDLEFLNISKEIGDVFEVFFGNLLDGSDCQIGIG